MFWSLLAFLAVTAGHAELWITLVNRVYGLPIPIRTLHRIRATHDVAIFAFPCLVYWRIGLSGPSAFFSGQWGQLSPPWIVVFLACSAGLAGLIYSIGAWWIRTRRCMTAGTRVALIALPRGSAKQEDTGSAETAGGRTELVSAATKRLTRFPLNQQFELETTEKQLAPANWPAELDGLSILHLSDWHLCSTFSRQFYETAAAAASRVRADMICFSGDLSDDIDCLDWLPTTLGSLSAPLGNWFILGNHDALIDHAHIRSRMVAIGWNDLGGKTAKLDVGPATVVVGGDEVPWLNAVPRWSADDRALPRLLLAHSPDRFPHHSGEGVDLILAGHTHGGQIILPVVGPVYAPSRYGCRFPSGVYVQGSTVMHVSRGLAGMHPIRFGARPEITRLVIRSPKCLAEHSRDELRTSDREQTQPARRD
ncbi:putative metallophosphoesterase [Caulifigura coniformis]|uniref:Putative metallophosphoesterase n=1 Tax=Caulifigura coniformis TaxID=2527983 RepID=A0A517SJW5_9PLAN|nr:metallophosphoesterase [Caulifigura coniformis]QDT56408.1 putative metallophosphoesterase [Caulifigura coniformis]